MTQNTDTKPKPHPYHTVGCARYCRHCRTTNAYHAPTANWQNRVVCLNCNKKWSE